MYCENLRKIREARKLTRKQMADLIGIPYTTYIGYETLAREPKKDQVEKIAQALNVNPAHLMGLSMNNQAPSEVSIFDAMFGDFVDYENEIADIHFTTDEYTLDEIKEIIKFAEFIKSKRSYNFEVNAAHERSGATVEDKAHDDALMDDENF
ncbi:MAG: family transcriptional regulator [Herbinix sp.]|jgi:transcriptional regulator with XRE-family HTH domain|nr:family transcriptional regulator [Herbinix sp.]